MRDLINQHSKVIILNSTPVDKQIENFKKRMLKQGYKVTVIVEDNEENR